MLAAMSIRRLKCAGRLALAAVFAAGAQASPGLPAERDSPPGPLAEYLTAAEEELVRELNAVRADPRGYAEGVVKPMTKLFRGKLLAYPGEVPIVTQEGVAAVEQCYRFLREAAPVPALQMSEPLGRAAADQVRYQGPRGEVGHGGPAGQSPADRVHKYAPRIGYIGENIAYGTDQPRRIVAQLLIDDGVPSRGHRENIMNPDYDLVGLSIGPHKVYGSMCVMVFARSQ